jgi:hypothetical protein
MYMLAYNMDHECFSLLLFIVLSIFIYEYKVFLLDLLKTCAKLLNINNYSMG